MADIITIRPERSNHIQRVAYDPDVRHLHVIFTNQSAYTYGDVPPQVFATMTRQQSMGEYFHRVIKRHYPLLAKQKALPEEKTDGNRTSRQTNATEEQAGE
jgi:hypothetical protein